MAPIDLTIISKYRNQIYGVAALWVVADHAFEFYWLRLRFMGKIGNIISTFGGLGYIAVDMFLFLSGISLYYAYQKKPTLNNFIQHRLKRLLPTIMLIVWPVAFFVFIFRDHSIGQLLLRLSTLQVWISSYHWFPWFASAIIVFYLLFPYIYIFIYENKRNTTFNFLVLLGFVLLCCLLIHHYSPEQYANSEVALSRLPIFIIGIYAGQYFYKAKQLPAYTWLILFFSFSFYLYYILVIHVEFWRWYYRYILPFGAIPLVFFIAFLFKHIATIPKLNIANRIFKRIGDVSLEIYLAHALVYLLIPYAYQPDKPDKSFWFVIWFIGMVIAITYAFCVPHLIKALTIVIKRSKAKMLRA